MLIKSLRALNHVLCVIRSFVSRRTPCQTSNVKHAITDFIRSASTNGFRAVGNQTVFSASSLGVELEWRKTLNKTFPVPFNPIQPEAQKWQ